MFDINITDERDDVGMMGELGSFPLGFPKHISFSLLEKSISTETLNNLKKIKVFKHFEKDGRLADVIRRYKFSEKITDKQKRMFLGFCSSGGRNKLLSIFNPMSGIRGVFDFVFLEPYLKQSRFRELIKSSTFALDLIRAPFDIKYNNLTCEEKYLIRFLLSSEVRNDAFSLAEVLLDVWRHITDPEIPLEKKKIYVDAYFGISSYLEVEDMLLLLSFNQPDVYKHYFDRSMFYFSKYNGEVEDFEIDLDLFSEVLDEEKPEIDKRLVHSLLFGMANQFLVSAELVENNLDDCLSPDGVQSKQANLKKWIEFENRLFACKQSLLPPAFKACVGNSIAGPINAGIAFFEKVMLENKDLFDSKNFVLMNVDGIKSAIEIYDDADEFDPRFYSDGFVMLRKFAEEGVFEGISSIILLFEKFLNNEQPKLMELSKNALLNISKITELARRIDEAKNKFAIDYNTKAKSVNEKISEILLLMSAEAKASVQEDEKPISSDLNNEMSNLQGKVVMLESSIAEYEAQLKASHDEVAALKHQVTQMTDSVSAERQHIISIKHNKHKEGVSEHVRELLKRVIQNPARCSLEDQLHAISCLNPDSVVVLPSAFKSAKESNYSQGDLSWSSLMTLCDKYLPAILGGKPDSEARRVFPVKVFAANESSKARAPGLERTARTGIYNGKEYVFEKHLRLGFSMGTTKTMRIHFDVIEGKLVIFHFGKHLD